MATNKQSAESPRVRAARHRSHVKVTGTERLTKHSTKTDQVTAQKPRNGKFNIVHREEKH